MGVMLLVAGVFVALMGFYCWGYADGFRATEDEPREESASSPSPSPSSSPSLWGGE